MEKQPDKTLTWLWLCCIKLQNIFRFGRGAAPRPRPETYDGFRTFPPFFFMNNQQQGQGAALDPRGV